MAPWTEVHKRTGRSQVVVERIANGQYLAAFVYQLAEAKRGGGGLLGWVCTSIYSFLQCVLHCVLLCAVYDRLIVVQPENGRGLARVLTHAGLPCMKKLMTLFVYIQFKNISNSSCICQKLAAEQLQTRGRGTVRQGRRHGPSIPTQISPGWVTLLQPGGSPCWVIAKVFDLIGLNRNQPPLMLGSTNTTFSISLFDAFCNCWTKYRKTR